MSARDDWAAMVSRRKGIGNCEPVITRPRPMERDVQSAVLELLNLHPKVAFAWRSNTGVAKYEGKNGAERLVAYGFKGCADILGMLRGGRFLAIECKRPGEKPTDEQRIFLEAVNGGGGLGFAARSVDDVMRALEGLRHDCEIDTRSGPRSEARAAEAAATRAPRKG